MAYKDFDLEKALEHMDAQIEKTTDPEEIELLNKAKEDLRICKERGY
jgi:hypothetical protein